jgi:hypothetical protein
MMKWSVRPCPISDGQLEAVKLALFDAITGEVLEDFKLHAGVAGIGFSE